MNNFIVKSLYLVFTIPLFMLGCASAGASKDYLKDLSKTGEHTLYGRYALMASSYCAQVYNKGIWSKRTLIEARREIRQSDYGHYGPLPPRGFVQKSLYKQIGDETLNGKGPIVRIYCQGDIVPEIVWKDLARTWQD